MFFFKVKGKKDVVFDLEVMLMKKFFFMLIKILIIKGKEWNMGIFLVVVYLEVCEMLVVEVVEFYFFEF